MTEKDDQNPFLLKVVSIAEQAGEAIMTVYRGEDFGTSYKDDHSPLTRADLAAHHLILDELKELTPQWPAISEESQEITYEMRRAWSTYWLIDPLDGTKEFIKRNDEFTVNIALIENGVPIMGVVHAPALDVTYYAARAKGAFKRKGGAMAEQITVRDYRKGRVKILTSQSRVGEALAQFLERVGPHDSARVGSSLKLCLVAEGAADLYPRFGRTMEWDTAAAHCVVTEAGGSVTDREGHSLHYNKPELGNPEFFVRGNPPFPLTST